MNIIKFKECNCIFAEDQFEYQPLPAHRSGDGIVTSCWKLSFWERIGILFSGCLFVQTLTFRHPLQPLKLLVGKPDEIKEK